MWGGWDSNPLTASPLRRFVNADQFYRLVPLPPHDSQSLLGVTHFDLSSFDGPIECMPMRYGLWDQRELNSRRLIKGSALQADATNQQSTLIPKKQAALFKQHRDDRAKPRTSFAHWRSLLISRSLLRVTPLRFSAPCIGAFLYASSWSK